MRIKLKYPDIETFIQKYAVNISRGGIFIATKQPKPVGTPLKFEFLLANTETGTSIIRGEGQVQWTREFDPAQPNKAHGMGVRFTRLDPESQGVVDRALAWRAQQQKPAPEPAAEPAPERGASPHAPLADAPSEPTRVAPSSEIAAALGAAPLGAGNEEQTVVRSIATEPVGNEEQTVVRALPRLPAIDVATDADTLVRGRSEPTRPIAIDDVPGLESQPIALQPRPRDAETKPIELGPKNGRPRREPVRDDLDALAAEWGVSEEQLSRVLDRARPRMVEATAELERLLRKPPRSVPSKAEALAGLSEILEKRSTQVAAAAAGGEKDPQNGSGPKRR